MPDAADARALEGTARQAVASLLQWRDWLEHLAAVFGAVVPPPGAGQDVRSAHSERAVARLVTDVVERTQCEEHGYALAVITLRWYFEACGFTPEEADTAADTAQDGSFHSWVHAREQEVRDYAESLAAEATGAAPCRER